MNDKALRILEYHKIINLLIDKATSLPGKEVCKKLTPMTELAAIEEAQQQTADAFTRLIKGGRIHFSDNKDISFSLKSLEIGKTPGVRLYLRDVAELELISKEIRQEGYFNRQAGVSIEIVKKGEANAVEVIREVRKRFEQIKGSRLLPGGMELLWFKDSGEFIISSVDDAWNSIITGILLTALLLFLFLHEPRSTFIIAVTMPVSVVVTFAAMQMMHYTFDMITLMSLGCSTGVLVTNSIVVIESIVNRLSAGAGRKNAAAEGTAEVITAVSASALTNVVVFVPVAMMTSMVGMLLAPFAGVMVIATLVSLFVSFTLTPILASIMLSDKPHKPNRIMAAVPGMGCRLQPDRGGIQPQYGFHIKISGNDCFPDRGGMSDHGDSRGAARRSLLPAGQRPQ